MVIARIDELNTGMRHEQRRLTDDARARQDELEVMAAVERAIVDGDVDAIRRQFDALSSAGRLSVSVLDAAVVRVADLLGPEAARTTLGLQGTLRSRVAQDLANEIRRDADSARGTDDGGARETIALSQQLLQLVTGALTDTAQAGPGEPVVSDLDFDRAQTTADLAQTFARDLGLATRDVTIKSDEEARERVGVHDDDGLTTGGVVYLDPSSYDPSTDAGKALLAHEMVHVAQTQLAPSEGQSSSGRDLDGLAAAESEAYAQMEVVATGGTLAPATVGLDAMDEAACGPRSMQEDAEDKKKKEDKKDDKKDDKTEEDDVEDDEEDDEDEVVIPEVVVIEDDPPDIPEPTIEEEPGDCIECPDPDAEHAQAVQIRKQPDIPIAGDEVLISIRIAGHKIDIKVSAEQGAGEVKVKFKASDSPFEALKLKSAVIQVDGSLNILGGQIQAGIQLGNYVKIGTTALNIHEGGAVSLQIKDAELKVNDNINARVDLNITKDGIYGACTVRAEQISLGGPYSLKDCMLHVRVDATGKVSAHGKVTFDVGDIFGITLEACFVDGEWRGKLGFVWEQDIQLVEGLVLERAELTGCYSKEAWSIYGRVDLGVGVPGGETFGAVVQAKYTYSAGAGKWWVRGDVLQRVPVELAPGLTLEEAHAGVEWNDGTWSPATFGGKVVHEYVVGSIEGVWDIEKDLVSGIGKVELVKELPLGDTGATLDKATIEAEVKDNVLTEIRGETELTFPYQDLPTFRLSCKEAVYRVPEEEFDALGAVKTLRDITFGAPQALNATVFEGAGADLEIKNSKLIGITGGLDFVVSQVEKVIGEGDVNFTFSGAKNQLDGKAQFTLIERTGLPDFEVGPVFLLPGGHFEIDVVKSELGTAVAKDVKFEVIQAEGTGKIEGDFAGSYDFGTQLGNLNGNAKVTNDWPVPTGDWGTLTLKTGGSAEVAVVGNVLEKCDGKIPFEMAVNANQYVEAFTLSGKLEGNFNTVTQAFDGSLTAKLDTDLNVNLGDSGDKVVIEEGSNLTATMVANEPQTITIPELKVSYHRGEDGLFLEGILQNALFDFTTGELSFEGKLTLKQEIDAQLTADGVWTLHVLPEVTHVDCTMEKNVLTRVGGSIEIELRKSEEPLLKGSLTNAELTLEEMEFTGDLDLEVMSDMAWPPGPDAEGIPPKAAFVLCAQSHVGGHIEKNTLTEASIDFIFRVDWDGVPLANATLNGTWNFVTDKVSGDGTLTLARDFVLGEQAAGDEQAIDSWCLAIKKDSGLALKVTDNALDTATIAVDLVLSRGEEPVAGGTLNGEYRFGDEAGYTGALTIDMLTDVQLGSAGGFDIFLSNKTTVTGQVASNTVATATGDFILVAKKADVDQIDLTINTTYEGGSNFSGSAKLRVLTPVLLGEGGGADGYCVFLSTESGGTIAIENNEMKQLEGTIAIDIAKGDKPFARGSFTVDYDFSQAEPTIDAEGSIELIGEPLTLGTAAGYTFTLNGGSNIEGKVVQNDLAYIKGDLKLGVADAEGEFGTFEINGTYLGGTDPEFSGKAVATIHRDHDLGFEAFGYSFFLCAGTGFEVNLVASEITTMKGEISLLARQMNPGDEGVQGDIRMALNGTGDMTGEPTFSGTATADIDGDIHVGTAGDYAFSIQAGTGVAITVEKNAFTEFVGTMNGKVTENGVDFLGFECWVRYVDGDQATVDAKGSCKILGEKELYNADGYVFTLLPTEGPTAIINVVANDVKEVGGELAFRLENNNAKPQPLKIKGTAKGYYNNDTGMFSGSGGLFLESDLEFNLNNSGTSRITLLTGSGGTTEIKDNELVKLGGVLMGVLTTDDEPLVRLDAEGTYNAKTNVLEEFHGAATLLREMTLGPKESPFFIIDANLQADVWIKNNKLYKAKGSNGSFKVPPLNMKGGFEHISWSNETGRDIYSGKGFIEFQMLKEDEDKGRKMDGRIDVEYFEDDTWKAKGTVDYAVNHYLGGELTAEVDQELDPVLGGTLKVDQKEVMPGRELFNKHMKLFQMNMQFAIGVVPGTFSFGAEAYLGLNTKPMKISASVGVSNFRPKAMNVPDFSADAKIDWGVELKAGLTVYADVGIGLAGLAGVGGGVKGIAELTAPVDVSADAKINAASGKYWGEMGIGVVFAPTMEIKVKPYVYAQLGKKFTKDFEGLSYNLGELFKYEWGTSYKFGDEPPTKAKKGATQQAGGAKPSQKSNAETSQSDAESMGPTKTPNAPTPKPGEPALESGQEMANEVAESPDKSKPPSEMSEMEQKIQMISDLAEVAGAAADIISQLVTILMCAAMGPIVFVLCLCWKWVTGALDRLVQNIELVIDYIVDNWDMIAEYMPDWWQSMMDFFANPASAIDKWWNGDVYTRQAVNAGEHKDAPPEVRGKMCATLFSGYCAEGDRNALTTIFEYSASKGDLRQVLRESEYDGDDYADSWWRHRSWGGSRLKKLWDKHGIEYS